MTGLSYRNGAAYVGDDRFLSDLGVLYTITPSGITIDPPTSFMNNPPAGKSAPLPAGSSLLDQTMAQIAASQPSSRPAAPNRNRPPSRRRRRRLRRS